MNKPSARPPQRNTGVKQARPLQCVVRPLAALKLYQGNPREHSAKQIKQIAHSIETFGFNVPVLIDGAEQVIAGHGRVLACRHLGWTDVPTIQLDHLSPMQARAFMLADNRLTDLSSWNDVLLAETLRDLSLAELDFNLEAIGFEMGEIDLRIESLENDTVRGPDPADTCDKPLPGPAVTKHGDLWVLGRHRLLCGDALDAQAFAQLLAGKRAAMVFTDPPYNVPIAGHVSGLGAIQHREFAMAVGEMSKEEFTNFLQSAMTLIAHHSQDGSLHFVCMDWRHLSEVLTAGQAVYSELKNLCVWAKDNAGMGSLYRSQHELVLVYKSGRGGHRNNVELGRHGRHRSNIWRYAGVNSFGRNSEEGNLLNLHPTVKPVALVADAILDCTARGAIVLDPFLGSGTTLIAAERVGRRCYGLELDPLYVDTIVRRWQTLTGDEAQHATSGETFDARASSMMAAVPFGQPVFSTSTAVEPTGSRAGVSGHVA